MNSTHAIDIDRAFDLSVLAAIPPTLGLFAPGSLEAQLREMTRQRRAICFTVMSPVTGHERAAPVRRIATVLVCLHVAPELAARGVDTLVDAMKRTVDSECEPVHELSTPMVQTGRGSSSACYREAVYAEAGISVAVTTHTPVQLPAETLKAVAAVAQGTPIDIVATIAVTASHPELPSSLGTMPHLRSTLQ